MLTSSADPLLPALPWPSAFSLPLLLLFTLLAGCADQASVDAADAPTAIRLYAFDGGHFKLNDVRVFSPPYPDTVNPVTIGNPCFLLVHPRGTLLWDAGLSDEYVSHPERKDIALGRIIMDVTVEDQLRTAGFEMSDIDYVAPSHMHIDHAGNLNKLTSATCLLQQAEFDAAFHSDKPHEMHFDTSTYDEYPEDKVRIIKDGHDVFGDGTAVIYAAPGHSPGHQVMLIRLPETGNIMLSGDLYHLQYNRDNRVNPAIQYDPEASFASMDRVDSLLIANDATLWVQHEPELSDTLIMAPAYYR